MLSRNICRFSRNVKNLRNISISPILYEKIYTDSDEWYLHTNFSTYIGITNNAREQLNEIVYIDFLFNPGDKIKKNDELCIIESIKATDVILSPFDCSLIKNNEGVMENLDEYNSNVEDYWLVKIKSDTNKDIILINEQTINY